MTSGDGILAQLVRLWRCGWDGLATLERSMETSPGPRILLTGFEPFGGDVLNPSGLVCRALHGQRVAQALVHAVELPCVFGRALQALDEALAATSPVLVVALGLAAGRAEISVDIDTASTSLTSPVVLPNCALWTWTPWCTIRDKWQVFPSVISCSNCAASLTSISVCVYNIA